MAAQVELEPGMVNSRLHLGPLNESSNKTLMEDSSIISSDPKKPTPGPKPRLTPKPFAVQTNTKIRPILAPKPHPKPKPESLSKPDPPSKPKPTSPALKSGTKATFGSYKPEPSPPLNDPGKLNPAETGGVARRTSLGPSASQSRPSEWTSQSKTGSSITRAKSMGFLSSFGLEEDVGKDTDEVVRRPQETRSSRPKSAIFMPEPAISSTSPPPWLDRRPLLSDLTAKFESSVQRQLGDSKENMPETSAPEEGVRRTDLERGIWKKDMEVQDAKPLERAGSGIKRRISLLMDSSSSMFSVLAPRGSEPRSAVPPFTDTDGAVGVKQRIKELTEDFSTAPNPLQKPSFRPRLLPTDKAKSFASDAESMNSSELKSVQEGVEELDKKSKDFHSSGQTKPQGDQDLSVNAGVQTVRASLFENVVEKHSVWMMEDAKSIKMNPTPRHSLYLRTNESSLFSSLDDEDDSSLVKATYQNLVSPSSPKRIDHIFDKVASVEESCAISENVSSAHLEEKALTLRRSAELSLNDGIPGNEQNSFTMGSSNVFKDQDKDRQSTGSVTEKGNTRYLRVGALPKWDETYVDKERKLEMENQREMVRKMEEEIQRQMEIHIAAKADLEDELENDVEMEKENASALRKPKVPETEDQQTTRPRATYFALTGQMNEVVHQRAGIDEEYMFRNETRGLADDRVKSEMVFDDFSVKEGRGGFQNRVPSIRRNPSMEPAFRKSSQERLLREGTQWHRGQEKEKEYQRAMEQEFERQKLVEYEKMKELEWQRELEKEKDRQKELEKESERQRELERERESQRELERERELEKEKERQKEVERQRVLERERQKEMERQRELERLKEIERQKQLEKDRKAQIEYERRRAAERELEQQREAERKRQKEIEIEKERLLEDERIRLREYEKQQEMERERRRQLELDRQREIEMQKQRELERQRELQRQKEQERQKELERQKQLDEMERWMQSEKHKALEREKQRRLDDLKKFQELEKHQLLEFQLQKESEREKQSTRKKQERVEEGPKETEQGKRTAESPLRPKVLDLDNVSLGDRFGKGLSSDQSPTPRWKQPSNPNEEVYKPSILDVDSFKNQTLPGVSVDPFGMNTFSSLDLVRAKPMTPTSGAKPMSPVHPQSLLQNLQRDTPPQSQLQAPFKSSFSEQARLPPPLQPQVLNQPEIQTFPTERPKPQTQSQSFNLDWIYGEHQFDILGGSQEEVAVDEPLWLSSTESAKRPTGARPSTVEQILQRQEERLTEPILSPILAPSLAPTLTPVQFPALRSPMIPLQMPTSNLSPSPGHVLSPEKIVNPDGLFAGSRKENQTALSPLVPEPLWSPVWEPASQEQSQNQQSYMGSLEQSRTRSRSVTQRPAQAETSVDGPLARIRSRSAHRDKRGQDSWEQLKQTVSGQDECKDTDTLVQETDSQYGTWDTELHTEDSLTPATPSSDSILSPRKPSLPHTLDQLSPEQQAEPLNFPQSPTILLDSSAQRSKAQLSKSCRRRRAPPSRAARHSAILSDTSELGTEEWMFKDSTEEKPDSAMLLDEESNEEQAAQAGDMCASSFASSQPQRVSLFPGMDPSALMAQLKKRGETESQTDGPSPAQLSRSPKSPFLGRAPRVLPPVGGKENGEESSPQWLKELKTKKRFSQIENDS